MFNFRDIGGYATQEGEVRRGRVIRSDAVTDLDDAERAQLRRLGIRTAIDLRQPGERDDEPSELDRAQIDVREVELIGTDPAAMTLDLLDLNLWLLDHRSEEILQLLRLLGSDTVQPVVFFCSSGKDRTGLLSALLLSALGVGDEDVIRDYMLTETLMPEAYKDRAVRRAVAGGMPEEWMGRYREIGLGSPARVMEGTLQHVHGHYGGTVSYLRSSGMAADELDRLRGVLVTAGVATNG